MIDIHCHACGGFITEPTHVSYRRSTEGTVAVATPRSGLCTCAESVVYGAPSGYASIPALKGAAGLN